jgi:succinoglycan biosynthesis protein ExoA
MTSHQPSAISRQPHHGDRGGQDHASACRLSPVACRLGAWPLVSVVIPTRNEEQTIAGCLGAVLAQDYPAGCMEVLVVDGRSTDRTRAIVAELAAIAPRSRVQLLDNPHRIASTALNIGIRAARGEIIARVDGHTILARDYLRRCVETLVVTGADNVGGLMRPQGHGYAGTCIALATRSRLGIGNSRFHYDERGGEAETVYLGCFRRSIFERVGLFDEGLVRNQDDELNDRIVAAGGRIWLSPHIRSTYVGRSSFRALWRQYYQYGYWKVRVLRRHPGARRLRHLAPAALVASLSSALFALVQDQATMVDVVRALSDRSRRGLPSPQAGAPRSRRPPATLATRILPGVGAVPRPLRRRARPLSVLAWGLYGAASLLAATSVAARAGWRYLPGVLVAFWCLHTGYGTGFLAGVLRAAGRRDRPRIPRLAPQD